MEDSLYEWYVKRLQQQDSELNVCRFCVLKRRKMSAISASQAELYNLFHRVTQIQLDTSAEYPDLICKDCELVLKETAKNISAFLEVETFWRTYLAQFKHENDDCSNSGSTFEDPPADHQRNSVQVVDDSCFVLTSELGEIKIELANSEMLHDFSVERLEEPLLNTELGYIKCFNCDEVFSEKLELEHHMNVCHQINNRRLSSQMRNHRNKIKAVNGLFTCEKCNESFIEKMGYKNHIRIEHKKDYQRCLKCNAAFKNSVRLRKHMAYMHDSKPSMMCDICNSTFHSKGQLSTHMRIHIKKSYICDICGQELRSLESMNRHRLTHNHEQSSTTDDRRRTGNKQNGHLPCSLCSNTYSRSATLREHLKKKHPIDGPGKWEEVAALMCIKCDEIFLSDDVLKEHREMHNKFQCSVCKQNMTCMEALVYHMSTHSKKDRPHACQLCGSAFIQKSHLTQHIRCVHSLERPHSCEQCNRSFAEKHELSKHVRAVHLQERRFGCDQCDLKFKKRNDLKVHQQSHTGVYRYKCDICNKNFGNSTKFTAHNANKHPNMFA